MRSGFREGPTLYVDDYNGRVGVGTEPRAMLHVLGDTRIDGVLTVAGTPSEYTQTYETADRTHDEPTATELTDSTAGTPATTLEALADGTTYGDDVASIRNNFASLAASNNAIIADLADVKQLVNAIIDDLQAAGLLAEAPA